MNNRTTRESVLDAFANQLLEFGYRGISLKAISTEAGIKRPSLYHHFPEGKEQIYTEVALHMIDTDAAQIQAACSLPGGLAVKLQALAGIHTNDPNKAALDQRIYDATAYVSKSTRILVSTRYVESILKPAQSLMTEAVKRGELRDLDPGFLMSAFFAMSKALESIPDDVAMPPEHRESGEPCAATNASDLVDIFLHGAGRT